ncbi:MAG TPA: hypothetical protein VEC36_04655 [Patescibacteria group bacterium]|nr:hypothetical protein [Patescibacteria group bacterium]
MRKQKEILLDFVIDKLTNSIQNTISGDSFQTEILRLTNSDIKNIKRKSGWDFDWKVELSDNSKEVYKLTIVHNPDIIQGLLSLTIESDHVLINLLESAPFNIGAKKLYEGVAGNLVAYACKISFQHGFDGYVAFTAKTKLIAHYEKSLGAFHLGGNRMIIQNESSRLLVEHYFKT